MAQAYLSTNELTYTWHDYSHKTKTAKLSEDIYKKKPKANIWLDTKDDVDLKEIVPSDIEKLKGFVAALYRNRNWTTYQVSYCKSQILSKQPYVSKEESKLPENELLECGKRLYSARTQKILKPMPTSRKLLGYISPYDMYTGLSEYEAKISKVGYEILERNNTKELSKKIVLN